MLKAFTGSSFSAGWFLTLGMLFGDLATRFVVGHVPDDSKVLFTLMGFMACIMFAFGAFGLLLMALRYFVQRALAGWRQA